MWIFTKYGFFSAVCARMSETSRVVDPNLIMVRARVRNHLEALKKRFSTFLYPVEIKEFVGSDYAYRLFIPKSVWAKMVADLAKEIDYDNFKSEVADFNDLLLGESAEAYSESLHRVWEVMFELQENEGQ
jgi:hypothetical protein